MEFIPAKESRFIIWFFYWYTRFLMRMRFRKVITSQNYHPTKDSRTVYFINHNYWWDGLLPLYLNNKFFEQKARALMEDKQMRQYPFFSKIGAFSVDLDDPRSSIASLRYAVQSMERPNSCLFIYPEGELVPPSKRVSEFKPGLAWLYKKTEGVDFVPMAFRIDHSKSSKPDLYISIGGKVDFYKNLDSKELTKLFENEIDKLLIE